MTLRHFPSTSPSIAEALWSGEPSRELEALERLSAVYWRPVYSYLRIRWRKARAEAEDLTQSFFVGLLENESWRKFDRQRGRLQTFLRRCIDNHAIGKWRREQAVRRGGKYKFLVVDTEAMEASIAAASGGGESEAMEMFRREWLRAVLSRAIERHETEMERRGKLEHLAVFRAICVSSEPVTHAELADRLAITKVDVNNRLAFAKRAFRRHVVEILRDQAANDEEFTEFLGELNLADEG